MGRSDMIAESGALKEVNRINRENQLVCDGGATRECEMKLKIYITAW